MADSFSLAHFITINRSTQSRKHAHFNNILRVYSIYQNAISLTAVESFAYEIISYFHSVCCTQLAANNLSFDAHFSYLPFLIITIRRQCQTKHIRLLSQSQPNCHEIHTTSFKFTPSPSKRRWGHPSGR